MSDGELQALRIQHLRGSVGRFVLAFEPGKKLTIVYGENGTGKSTICDAFELIGRGRVGSLDNRGLGQTNRYWPSLGNTRADVSVELDADGATCRATIGTNRVIASPPHLRPHVEVLRRGQILALIEATPSNRYVAIKRFVDVDGVERSEASLRDLIKAIERDLSHALARVQENRDTLQQFWDAADRPGRDPLQWAQVESARDASVVDAESAALERLSAAFARLTDYPDWLNTAESELADLHELRDHAKVELSRQLSAASSDTAEIVDLLRSAAQYLAQHQTPDACPLCECTERASGLADRVVARLESFTAIQQAQTVLEARDRGVQRAEIALADLQAIAREHAAIFEEQRAAAAQPSGVPLPDRPAPSDPSELQFWLAANAHLPSAWKRAEQARQDQRRFGDVLRMAVTTHAENVEAQKDLAALLPQLRRALEILEEERRAFTDETLSAITAEVGRLYELVHPGEGLNNISLILDPRKRASLEIGATFRGQIDSPPQAYFSDSHLDTLGLCIFLALAAMDEPASTILVLDDVLASADEPHAARLVEMLYDEASNFRQCILTTHYHPWREKLLNGWLTTGHCQLVELSTWSESTGLTLLQPLPAEP